MSIIFDYPSDLFRSPVLVFPYVNMSGPHALAIYCDVEARDPFDDVAVLLLAFYMCSVIEVMLPAQHDTMLSISGSLEKTGAG